MKKYKKGLTNTFLNFLWAVVGYVYFTIQKYEIFAVVVLLLTFALFAWNNYSISNNSKFFRVNSIVFMVLFILVAILHLAAYYKLIPDMWWIQYTFAISIVYNFAELIDFSGMEV